MSRDSFRIEEKGEGVEAWIADLRELERTGAEFKDRLDHATDKATELLRASMPVRTGALKASGRWSSRMEAGVYEATISFGGPPDYAVYVVGAHRNGIHEWDGAWAAGQALFAEVIATEFPNLPEGSL